MKRAYLRFSWILSAAAMIFGLAACKDNDNPEAKDSGPEFTVTVDKVERTSVEFTIQSEEAVDYAYVVSAKGDAAPVDGEALFAAGVSGMFENGQAKVQSTDIEGGKEYALYVATRKINPYVYSEVKSFDLSTAIPYEKMLTLDRVGTTDFKYHVEKPSGVSKVKHLVVRKNDYEAVKNMLAAFGEVTEELYLETFGLDITESTDIAYDKYGKDASGYGYDIHIHSDNTFLAMAGVVLDNGKIDEKRFECVEFNTRKAGEAPYDFKVETSVTSTSASVTITPDPEFVSYRAIIDSKGEFDFCRREGEQQVRYHIIGHWDDKTNPIGREYTGVNELRAGDLIPNTQYEVGIVGFDAEGREKMKMVEFITSAPTGPAPTITISEAEPSSIAPWSVKAFNVKTSDAVDIRYGFWTKAAVDEVLGRGASLEDVIKSNGVPCSGEQIKATETAEGLVFETSGLNPETEYMFCVYARTNEYVTAIDHRDFTTEAMPQMGGMVRANMPGNYIATTTDEDENPVSFPVTITTGVDQATFAEYSAKNRLVALGFGPADKFPYKSPSETGSDNPAFDYGPKWFIEFTEDDIHVPAAASKDWSMGMIDGKSTYIKSLSPDGRREFNEEFKVEVSEDGNTVTVKGAFHDLGGGLYCYPAMLTPGSGWFSPATIHFMCTSDIVLKRQESETADSVSELSMPNVSVVSVESGKEVKAQREAVAERLR